MNTTAQNESATGHAGQGVRARTLLSNATCLTYFASVVIATLVMSSSVVLALT